MDEKINSIYNCKIDRFDNFRDKIVKQCQKI